MPPWWLRVDAAPKAKPGCKRELEPGRTYSERDQRTKKMTLVRNSSSSGRWSSSRHHSAAETNEVVDGPSARPAQQRPSAPAGAEVVGPPAMPFSGPPPPYGPYPPPGYIMYPSSHPTPPRTAGQPYVGAGSGYHGARVPPPPPTRPTQAQPSRSRPAQPPPPSRPAQAPQQRPTQPPRPMPPPIPTTTERGLAAMVNDRRQEPRNAREAPSRGASRASRGHEQRSERSPSSAPHPHNCSGCGNALPNFCPACISESAADDARNPEGAAVREAKQVRFGDDRPGRRYSKEQWVHPPGSSSSDDRNFDPRRRPVKSHHRSRSTRDENAKEDRQGRGHGAEPRAGGHRAPQRPSPNEFGVVDQGTRVYRPVFPDQRLQDPLPSGLVSADARHRPSTRSSRNLDDAQLLEARMRFARLRDDDGLVPARVGSPDSTRAAWGGSPEPATTRRRHRAFSFTAADQLARRRAARTSPYWLDPYANPWATSSEEEYQQAWRDDDIPMPARHAVHDPPAARAPARIAPVPRLPYPPGYRPPYVETDDEYSSEQRG
ncbi:MAG: hypothetical protein M1815_000168 [Lichina confinis]|nr:MAG: hypothetical protein M1815_000168 [Lichina confinis]